MKLDNALGGLQQIVNSGSVQQESALVTMEPAPSVKRVVYGDTVTPDLGPWRPSTTAVSAPSVKRSFDTDLVTPGFEPSSAFPAGVRSPTSSTLSTMSTTSLSNVSPLLLPCASGCPSPCTYSVGICSPAMSPLVLANAPPVCPASPYVFSPDWDAPDAGVRDAVHLSSVAKRRRCQ